ncbi:MAG TPA: hypothetical protein VIT67_22775 [Povalibacter sp.]
MFRQAVAALFVFVSAFAGEEESTQVIHPEFSLSLPGEWSLISEPATDALFTLEINK